MGFFKMIGIGITILFGVTDLYTKITEECNSAAVGIAATHH